MRNRKKFSGFDSLELFESGFPTKDQFLSCLNICYQLIFWFIFITTCDSQPLFYIQTSKNLKPPFRIDFTDQPKKEILNRTKFVCVISAVKFD